MAKINERYDLYSSIICPFSRKTRFFMDELSIKHRDIEVYYWENEKSFLQLNPAKETPVLVDKMTSINVYDSAVICDYLYLQESFKDQLDYYSLYGRNDNEKYEIKRLESWFDKKFYNEITKVIIEEYFIKTYKNSPSPLNKEMIFGLNGAIQKLEKHIEYIELYLLANDKKWLANDEFSLADMSAVAQLSVIDYLGFIKWEYHSKMKEWYISVKQKRGFKNILNSKIISFEPAEYYNKFDF